MIPVPDPRVMWIPVDGGLWIVVSITHCGLCQGAVRFRIIDDKAELLCHRCLFVFEKGDVN